jgi:transposase
METLISLLNNLFPYKGYKFFVKKNKNDILIGLKSRRKGGICPSCGKRCSSVETDFVRIIRDLDLAGHHCFLEVPQKKIRCSCGYRGLEKLDFVSKSRRVTKRFETTIASFCEMASLKEVAERFKLDWKTVKEIDRAFIKALLPKISTLNVTRIAIDEIAIMKGHKYLTIIRDYDSGIPIKMVLGRGYEEVLQALLELGKDKLAKIYFASMDMWDPYIKAIKEACPNVELIFDKFHVVKKINEALDQIRKKEFASASDDERKNMKHKRYIILHREKNLDAEQKDELNHLIKSNDQLHKAYLLKEQVLSIFEDKQSTFEQIKTRIIQWMENIWSNEMEEFYGAVNTILNYFDGVMNYFKYGMTNAIAEGFNTKINIIKRRAFGFKDVEYFMLKIYQSTLKRFA